MFELRIQAPTMSDIAVAAREAADYMDRGSAGPALAVPPGGRSGPSPVASWGRRRARLLELNPRTQRLLELFGAAIARELPDAQIEQNRTTRTITMPDGGQAGLLLRARYLLLRATRGSEKLSLPIRSEEEIAKGIAWLRDLPEYEDRGFGDPRRRN